MDRNKPFENIFRKYFAYHPNTLEQKTNIGVSDFKVYADLMELIQAEIYALFPDMTYIEKTNDSSMEYEFTNVLEQDEKGNSLDREILNLAEGFDKDVYLFEYVRFASAASGYDGKRSFVHIQYVFDTTEMFYKVHETILSEKMKKASKKKTKK